MARVLRPRLASLAGVRAHRSAPRGVVALAVGAPRPFRPQSPCLGYWRSAGDRMPGRADQPTTFRRRDAARGGTHHARSLAAPASSRLLSRPLRTLLSRVRPARYPTWKSAPPRRPLCGRTGPAGGRSQKRHRNALRHDRLCDRCHLRAGATRPPARLTCRHPGRDPPSAPACRAAWPAIRPPCR